MFIINYLFALLAFVIIYLAERLFLFWTKKKGIWPLISINLLIDAIAYSAFELVLLGILHLLFKKVNTYNLLFLDLFVYIFLHVLRPHQIFNSIKSKEKFSIKKNHIFGASLFVAIILECFVFNAKAYSNNKEHLNFKTLLVKRLLLMAKLKAIKSL